MKKGGKGGFLIDLVAAIAGAVAGAKLSNMNIPVIPANFRGAIPLAGGALVMKKSKSRTMQALGMGLSIGGGVNLIKVNFPTLGIGNDDDQMLINGITYDALAGPGDNNMNDDNISGGSYALAGSSYAGYYE